jgi:hypothetical protein
MPETVHTMETSVEVRPGPLAAGVLARVLGLLSARAELSVDRVGDVLLVSDTLAAADGSLQGEWLRVTADWSPGRLGVQIGPYRSGGAARIAQEIRIDGFAVLERLADEVSVVARDQAEYLRLAFVQQ